MRPFTYISTTTILFTTSIPVVSSFTHPTSVASPTVTTSLQLLPKQGCQLVAASEAIYAKQHQQYQQDKKEQTQDQFHVKNNQATEQSSSSWTSCNHNSSMVTPTNAARIFLSRVFSLPSPTINDNDRPFSKSQATDQVKLPNLSSFDSPPAATITTTTTTTTNTNYKDNEKNNNEVFYPITGFTFVTTTNPSNPNETTVHVLPPPNTSQCACNIDSVKQSQNLPLFGWFSPACPLDS